ncbi:MAG: hypothetical protein ACLP0L_25720 [Solirubrobacteraceae bacterium]
MTATNQPDLSPAPGIIPEPARVTSDAIPLTAVGVDHVFVAAESAHHRGDGGPDRVSSSGLRPVSLLGDWRVLCKKD